MIKPNDSVYARPHSEGMPGDYMQDFDAQSGISIRAWYAGLAMQGILASGTGGEKELKVLAAVDYADALIAELNGENA